MYRVLSIIFIVWIVAATAMSAKSQTNIVFVFVDDLGYGDYTPAHMPQTWALLHEKGTSLNLYSQQNCVPSRVAWISGNDPSNYDLHNVFPIPTYSGLPLDVVTLPQLLQDNGYTTGIFGKWHLGLTREQAPYNRGFHQAVNLTSGHFNSYGSLPNRQQYPDGTVGHDHHGSHDLAVNGLPLYTSQYATWLFRDSAIEFMQSAETPSFTYVPFNAPHSPYSAPRSYFNLVKANHGVTPADEAFLFEYADNVLGIPHRAQLDDETEHRLTQALYYAMVLALDSAIADIYEALPDPDNTLFIFSSDNGAAYFAGSSGDLRGLKGTPYEGGHYVANGIIWPSVVSPEQTVDADIWLADLYETFAAAAGVEADTDGTNILPALVNNESLFRNDKQAIIHHVDKRTRSDGTVHASIAINELDYKYIRYSQFDEAGTTILSTKEELYNLSTNPNETINIINAPESAVVRESMRQHYIDWGGDSKLAALTSVDVRNVWNDFAIPYEWGGFELMPIYLPSIINQSPS